MGGFENSLHISLQFRQYPLSAAVPQINNKWQGFCEEQQAALSWRNIHYPTHKIHYSSSAAAAARPSAISRKKAGCSLWGASKFPLI